MRTLRITLRSWPLIIGLYDGRECPDCGSLVCGKAAKRVHQRFHRDLEDQLGADDEPERELREPDGYVIGNGPLPASVRGGGDE